ncbi:MAG: hypothetical protein V1800_05665 [Candidatus Latescibacterota bacterium]
MTRVVADIPISEIPSWAVWQRRLFDSIDQSVHPFLEHFTREDGEFIWEDAWGGGSPDDFLEPFFNWPLVYLMGGGDHLLSLGHRQFEAITGQLMRLGSYHKEYGFSEDQMHQSEADVLFYHLCLANPDGPRLRERAQRFAGFYLNEDPEAINYDPDLKIVLSGLNGSKGAIVTDVADGGPYAPVGTTMEPYGLPFFDLPGITKVTDLADPANAARMGRAMQERWKAGDAPANLAITSQMTNAFLMTGQEKYREWVVAYTDAWMKRARKNDGLLPDQVGPSGKVGEYVGGKWYGGRYGWTFPHGFLTMHFATIDAAANAYLLTRDDSYLDLPRAQMDRILEMGEMRDHRQEHMSVGNEWEQQLSTIPLGEKTFLVPYRYGDAGWFDWQPLSAVYPIYLWHLSMRPDDWERVERLREAEAIDWDTVFSFRDKNDSGHEPPWVRFLAGENDGYPERILHTSHEQLCRRLAQLRTDPHVGTRHHIHHWQWGNPVTSEALIQLTLGAPQPIYNGGLLHARLRYFDVSRRRPGLPPDVAALVETLEADRTVVRLVNLSPTEPRSLLIQAGTFGEHRFGRATYQARTSEWPGELGGYAGTYHAPALTQEERHIDIQASRLQIELPAAAEIRLDLETQRYVNEPSYAMPW